ncbi:hypothetical protein QL285_076023 [Trifolium repens]|nr:hypothetical protein QL285_076023 [Trifolium repens]
MLSGWSTAGRLACPICMNNTKAFILSKGKKTSWFDCHRQFLPHDHAFRRNKVAFLKNRIERDEPPPRLSGEQVWEKVYGIPKITDSGKCVVSGRGVLHNWTKRSIFWDLPYWRHNLLRHNLDVMHIEKNVFDTRLSKPDRPVRPVESGIGPASGPVRVQNRFVREPALNREKTGKNR